MIPEQELNLQSDLSKMINECPKCYRVLDPRCINLVDVTENNLSANMDMGRMKIGTFYCKSCHAYFHAYFIYFSGRWINTDVYPITCKNRIFSETISNLSPCFVICYNQSLQAESERLDEISGLGFRKAIEYLIKDFVSDLYPENAEDIRADKKLSNVLLNRLPNEPRFADLKDLSRCAWILGCDFTHYNKVYENYDINDLKACIDLALNEIESFYLKAEYKKTILKK